MRYCVAFGCRNSTENGKVMKGFPKDSERRELWATKVRRADWKPTNSSCLCEDHFDDSQWEKTREDGTRKLKCNAVPTIFDYNTPEKTCTKNKIYNTPKKTCKKNKKYNTPKKTCKKNKKYNIPKKTCKKNKVSKCTSNGDAQECSDNSQTLLEPELNAKDNLDPQRGEVHREHNELWIENTLINGKRSVNSSASEQSKKRRSCHQLSKPQQILPKLQEKCSDFDKRAFLNEINHQNFVIRLQKRIKGLEQRNELLREQYLELHKFRESSFEGLDDLFNDDQKKALCREDTRGVSWSQETIEKALEIRLACGSKGYDFLLLKGYPLPSARTLRRKVQSANVQEDGIVFDLNQEEENDKTE